MSDEPIESWIEFFDRHAPNYDKNSFTQWTKTEVSFLENVLGLKPGDRILDMGCGTGRHSIELTKRGYFVTGVDISEGMLAVAREKADAEGVKVDWRNENATQFSSEPIYDHAICLCEGAFGLANPDVEPVSHDLAILRAIYQALKPGGKFVLTALNGYATIRRVTDEMVEMGSFDPVTMQFAYQDEFGNGDEKFLINVREHMFIPPELVSMLRHLGFSVLNVWGGTAGEWGQRRIKLDEIEVMYVAQK